MTEVTHDLRHPRKQALRPALSARLLRGLLWGVGYWVVVASRLSARVRRQITRDITIEISTDDGVARHWVFDGSRRQVSVSGGRAEAPDLAVHFVSSGQALRDLTSSRAIDRTMDGWLHGTVRLEGSTMLLPWFYDLPRVAVGRAGPRRRALPGAYLAHDPAANGREQIRIEPGVRRLDPGWSAAWNARSKLWIVRGANGEPLREP